MYLKYSFWLPVPNKPEIFYLPAKRLLLVRLKISPDVFAVTNPRVNIQRPSQYLLLPPGEGWDEGIK